MIAIENVRLFNETKEALGAARPRSAEVLRVISESPTDMQPVFEAIIAARAPLRRPMAGCSAATATECIGGDGGWSDGASTRRLPALPDAHVLEWPPIDSGRRGR